MYCHLCFLLVFLSYYLWSISQPGKTGTPNFDLSKDPEANVANSTSYTPVQLAHERVITKVFNHYAIPLDITDCIRSSFKAKLWRMGKRYSKQGGKQREQQLSQWKDGVWSFEVSSVEVNRQLLKRRRSTEIQLKEETEKRRKLESEMRTVLSTTKKQAKRIARLSTGRKANSRGSSSKPWSQYTRQQWYNKRKSLVGSIQGALSVCEDEGFKARSVELEIIDTGTREVVDLGSGTYSPIDMHTNSTKSNSARSVLYIKDKFSVSNEAFHELSMVSSLPSSSQIKSVTKKLNDSFNIYSTPNGTVGVQQSLRERIIVRLTYLIDKSGDVPSTIRIKLTGDGTQIARNLSVVNVSFTMLEEGQHKACSAFGNHSLAILRVSEKYEELKDGLEDIIAEAKDLEVLTIRDKVYTIQFFLGGDLKFLAAVCGVEAANAEHACVWCKCPKNQRWDMSLTWSIQDQSKGARTVEEIKDKCKLGKTSKKRFNCCHPPIFPFVPIQRVIIDSLHLFLRIADVLINLLIRDLRILDGIDKATNFDQAKLGNTTNMKAYQVFLNDVCKIRFQWIVEKEGKKLIWRDLTGPEKRTLFEKINVPTLFPSLRQKQHIQKLWDDFYELIRSLSRSDCDADNFEISSKNWVRLFISVYQTKDVTPYIHAFAQHLHEFLRLYGNVVIFSQQGLEKLNDLTTKHYQRATNHKGCEAALKQVLEKRNRIELLEDDGCQRSKQVQKCSLCKQPGHNRRSCTHEIPDCEVQTTDNESCMSPSSESPCQE